LTIAAVTTSKHTDPNRPARNLIDGNLDTSWRTLPNAPAEAWFVLDLGRSRAIDRVRWFVGDKSGAVAYRIQVSANGQQWQTVATLSAGASNTWYQRAIGREARYVRWLFANPTNVRRLGNIAEVEVFGR
jgi:hyaluronoglucosaminidase